MGKILIFISIAISFATVGLGIVNKGTLGTRTEELAQTTEVLGQTKQDLATSETNLKTAEESLATTTAQKEEALAKAQTAQTAAEDAKAKASELESQITQKDGEISKLTADIADKESELAELRGASPTGDSSPSEEQVVQLQEKEAVITKLQGDLEVARTQLADLRQRDTERQQLKMRDGLQGRILAVNQAWNFVVLNLGDKNGVVSNAEMLVKRGNSLIGKVRITSVEPATSIADIVVSSVPQGLNISPGDNVIFQAVGE